MKIERAGTTFTVTDSRTPGNPGFWGMVTWEQPIYAALAEVVGSETIFIDVGAWVGPYALWAAARCRVVYAFEPDPVAYEILQRSAAAVANLQVFPYAVWSADGCMIGVAPRGSGALGNSQTQTSTTAPAAHHVPSITIDALAPLLTSPADVVLKIDVEGAEGHVIAGGWRWLTAVRPPIALSVHAGIDAWTVGRVRDLIALYGRAWSVQRRRLIWPAEAPYLGSMELILRP